MRYPGGWNKDRWKVTEPGNRKWFYAEHDNGIMLWLEDPGGRGDNWGVYAGAGTGSGDKKRVETGLSNKRMAEGVLEAAMEEHPWPDSPREMRTSSSRRGGLGLGL